MTVPATTRFAAFTEALARATDVRAETEPGFFDPIVRAMQDLVAADDWLAPRFALPGTDRYQQYLLFRDPDDRFSVVSFVWAPDQHTPIHDHTVWGVVGMLRGSEISQSFSWENGRMIPGPEKRLEPGDVITLSPVTGDIHRVRNALADEVSISIHAYGGNIGETKRHIFDEDGVTRIFVSGYSNLAPSSDKTEHTLV